MRSSLGRIVRLPSLGRRWVTTAVAGLALALTILIPAANVGAQGYPPNALISTYFDPRYCGNGAVSVVTDAGGALINICTSTGQRILPVYPDYGYGYGVPYGYNGYSGYNTYNYRPYAYNTYNYGTYNYGTYNAGYNYGYANNAGVVRRYTDSNTNCPSGDVTQTVSGYFCSANGAPAFSTR